jgi:demethylmenaquinone methyltransferase/2-methoxy-6-polyprenyl-1,4-benzoquinol methylase
MTGAALPQGADKVRAVDTMFDTIAPRYDLLNRLLTFGMDVGWRKKTVRSLRLAPGAVVLDLACGTGDLCRELAAARLRPVGIDRSAGMLAAARARRPGRQSRRTGSGRARAHRLGCAALVRGDGLQVPVPDGAVDGVVCGFALRNFLALEPFFAECARVLRPGGRVALLEVSQPANPVLRAGHAVYFGRVVPLVGGLVSDRAAYRYLPESLAYLPPDPAIVALLAQAGFSDADRQPLSVGIAQLLTGTRA